jgi:hypothetical protein
MRIEVDSVLVADFKLPAVIGEVGKGEVVAVHLQNPHGLPRSAGFDGSGAQRWSKQPARQASVTENISTQGIEVIIDNNKQRTDLEFSVRAKRSATRR